MITYFWLHVHNIRVDVKGTQILCTFSCNSVCFISSIPIETAYIKRNRIIFIMTKCKQKYMLMCIFTLRDFAHVHLYLAWLCFFVAKGSGGNSVSWTQSRNEQDERFRKVGVVPAAFCDLFFLWSFWSSSTGLFSNGMCLVFISCFVALRWILLCCVVL